MVKVKFNYLLTHYKHNLTMIKYSKIIFILMSDYKLTLFVNEKTLIPDLIKRPLVGYYATRCCQIA